MRRAAMIGWLVVLGQCWTVHSEFLGLINLMFLKKKKIKKKKINKNKAYEYK